MEPLYFFFILDEITGKPRKTSYRMTEADAKERFGIDAVRDDSPGSKEVRQPIGSAGQIGNRRSD